ncbi:small-conductance mechanosensitive channel [Haloferula luteola]|uniref:Small-conductance mechanosensitive channel n=1 Tax=Haloferula luteola TaxID=595692 RepID=A0A840V6M1_9BACT|nr:hypothetical protein [Haloferula luteola]MBB5353313.1 small-conductance mechanosensitive channel [Haloferula luteola]
MEFLEKGEQFLGELAFACNRGATTPEELDDAREALAELMESDAVIGLCEEMQLAWETVEAEAKEQQLLTTSSSDLQENLPNVQAQILDPLVANSLEKLEKARKAATASWEGRKEEPSLEEKRNSLAELDPILAELHRNQAKVEAKGRLKDAQTRITELEVELNKAVSQ